MGLVYDRDDSGAGLPVYVPRRRRRLEPAPLERVRPMIGALGAGVTLERFKALAEAAFDEREAHMAVQAWAVGFYEGVRAARRRTGVELPALQEGAC